MASGSCLTMSLLKLSYPSSASLQTQTQVGSSLFRLFPTKTLKLSATPQFLTSRRCFNTTNTLWNWNNQQQYQDSSKSAKVHELRVYEFNEGGKDTPAYLKLIQKSDNNNSLGDLVPFSNTLYSGDLQKKLGITAGLCVFIRPEKKGDRYEAIYSFYFKNLGHISVQGTYLKCQDKNHRDELAVTGGSGNFKGVSGRVILQQLEFASKMFYTFYLEGIPDFPNDLLWRHVDPSSSDVKPSETARKQPLD